LYFVSDSLETKTTAPLVIVARILGSFLGLELRLLRVRAVFDIGMPFVVAMGPNIAAVIEGEGVRLRKSLITNPVLHT
jgi:hypothetical protein